tara:strand:+ start:20256 stop:20429 length:174 start_codon:yes stop_codon:yes gene_type:complete
MTHFKSRATCGVVDKAVDLIHSCDLQYFDIYNIAAILQVDGQRNARSNQLQSKPIQH